MPVYDFRLAERVLRLELPCELRVGEAFAPFAVSGTDPDCVVTFEETQSLPPLDGAPLFWSVSAAVYRAGESFPRLYHEHRDGDRPYAVGRIALDGVREKVLYLSGNEGCFADTRSCFSHIAVEELMLGLGRLMLHASFVSSPWGGILFCGPSGIGKSTQAELWSRYMGSEVINGDRPFVGLENGEWCAWGSPYAGSSGYHVARSEPIAAIVMLEQGTDDHLERMTPRESFTALFASAVINSWNPRFVAVASDMAAQLAAEIPVLRYRCTPEVSAVTELKRALEEICG